MIERLIRIESPGICAGLVAHDAVIVQTAPIVSRYDGWRVRDVFEDIWFHRGGSRMRLYIETVDVRW